MQAVHHLGGLDPGALQERGPRAHVRRALQPAQLRHDGRERPAEHPEIVRRPPRDGVEDTLHREGIGRHGEDDGGHGDPATHGDVRGRHRRAAQLRPHAPRARRVLGGDREGALRGVPALQHPRREGAGALPRHARGGLAGPRAVRQAPRHGDAAHAGDPGRAGHALVCGDEQDLAAADRRGRGHAAEHAELARLCAGSRGEGGHEPPLHRHQRRRPDGLPRRIRLHLGHAGSLPAQAAMTLPGELRPTAAVPWARRALQRLRAASAA
mmetsp:Transcript_21350/g.60568  ORF Transcript_21350/g.60568 Transcript_21350/m.60568 type:complete len:268 (+) Transcript_21350:377-1180(+)